MELNILLNNAQIVNYDKTEKIDTLFIKNGVFSNSETKHNIRLDLKDYYVFPGFFNSHDHLLGTYLPKVGHGPYLNWKPWDEDLKYADLYAERGKLDNLTLYKLADYKQILSGVTTVSDHIPHIVNDQFIDKLYTRVIKDYALAHEATSYDLKWGDGLDIEIKKAKEKNIPFITHINEGYDTEAKNGINYLNKIGGLNKNSVLIHCVTCDTKDIKLIKKQNAYMVWCPNSNLFMYNDTADIKTFIQNDCNICLGTDSPMSGSLNLIEEIQTANKYYKKTYKKNLDNKLLYKMIITTPSNAFKLDDNLGKIAPGKLGDFVLTNKTTKDPYKTLSQIKMEDIKLVVREGIPLYGTTEFKDFFEISKNKFEKITLLSDNSKRLLIGNPLTMLKDIDKKLGFKKEFGFIPIKK